MIFRPTPLAGAFVVELERFADERGSFARTFCRREFAAQGLEGELVQSNLSTNLRAGTLRGMHYQLPPHDEVKLVRCSRGAIFDAIVDLRPASPTLGRAFWLQLSAGDGLQLYVPRGFAHGFLTLEDDTEVSYQMAPYFEPGHGRGFRWDDPAIAIPWPRPVTVISARDQALPPFAERETAP